MMIRRIAVGAACLGLAGIIAGCNSDTAPASCDPNTDYVCKPDTITQTTSVDVPTTSLSPTKVPVPSATQSPVVTTTVVP